MRALSRIAFIIGALGATVSASHAADYVLRRGDVLAFSVPSLQIQRRAVIGADSKVMIPIAGDFNADGKTLSQLIGMIRESLTKNAYISHTSDGRDLSVFLGPNEFVLDVAEYRPIYISGDVGKPGELSFRPGMIVGQAIALAGGYDFVRTRIDNPSFRLAEARTEYRAAWSDLIKYRTRIERLQAVLDLKPADRPVDPVKSPLDAEQTKQIAAAQTNEITARVKQYQGQIQALQQQVTEAADRLRTLNAQRDVERRSAELDASEEQRIQDVVQRGNAAVSRAADARRLSLLSATRVLQVEVAAEQTRKDRSDLLTKIQTLTDEKTYLLTKDLQDSTIELTKALTRRDGTREKLTLLGAARSQLGANPETPPSLGVSRDAAGERQRFAVQFDTELQPGDVLEVQLQRE